MIFKSITPAKPRSIPNVSSFVQTISKTSEKDDVFTKVSDLRSLKYAIKFFLNSYDDTCSEATNKVQKWFDNFIYKLMTIRYKIYHNPKTDIVEVLKSGSNTFGCYSLRFCPYEDCAHVNFLAVAPEVKDTKNSIKALYKMGKRIVEQAYSHGKTMLTWEADKNNVRAYRMYERFPADKTEFVMSGTARYYITLSDFNKTLDQFAGHFE